MVTLEPKFRFHDVRVNVGTCKECQYNRAEAGDVINPWRQRQAHRIACNCADDNLEQRGGNRDEK